MAAELECSTQRLENDKVRFALGAGSDADIIGHIFWLWFEVCAKLAANGWSENLEKSILISNCMVAGHKERSYLLDGG